MTYNAVEAAADAAGLLVMGALHPDAVQARGLAHGTLILLGAGDAFWPALRAASEARDGLPDPIDRWSKRVVGDLADRFGATARYPFGGPPYEPFIDWAIRSGRAFSSPTGMLVHDTVGMMISYRGALHFADAFAIPEPAPVSPCATCPDQPCTTTCPVAALSANAAYDVAQCHSHLDRPAGDDCMMQGCAARRACPFSRGAGRQSEQSAHHMKAFHSP